MPTNLLLSESHFEGFDSVLVTLEGVRSPRMLTVDLDSISPGAGGKKFIKPGTVMLRRPDGFGIPYKAAKVGAAVSTSATALTVDNAALFKPGDVLTVATPYARLDLAGTWANGDTATVTLDGQAVAHIVADYSTLTALAAAIAATLNTALDSKAKFIAEAQYIHIFGGDTVPLSAGETTAGDGTLAVAGGATGLTTGATVETIATGGVDVETNTLTLTGALDRRLPAGAVIGVATSGAVPYGMVVSPIDVTDFSNDVACYTSATVYGDRLPIWNSYLQRLFPEITLL